MIQVGGVDGFKDDYEIPMKYGVDNCIGDTMGPGGIFRAQRHIPALLEIAKEMRELCPNAILFNYANPMAMCCWALGHGGGAAVRRPLPRRADDDGPHRVVYGPQEGRDRLRRRRHQPHGLVPAAGEGRGQDLYPILKANFEKPGFYVNEKVRGEVMRHFGYFMTESTGHLSEYLPYFRKNRKALEVYCDEPAFGGETGAYYHYCAMIDEKFQKMDPLSIESTKLGPRSAEYCSHIIEAKETGRVFRLNGNIRNDGYITNLPDGCCVEVPIYVDRIGLHPTRVGALPRPCAALNMTNVLVQGLSVEAALSGDPELLVQAVRDGSADRGRSHPERDPGDDLRDARGRSAAGCRSSPARRCVPSRRSQCRRT